MPIVNVPLPEVDQLVSRPVINAIIEQVKQITMIPADTSITFVGQNNSRLQFLHETSPDKAPVKLSNEYMITVEVDEEPDEGFFATTAGNMTEQTPDFVDPQLGVIFKPIYQGMQLVMTLTLRTPSRSEAIRWRNDARYKASQMRSVNIHEVPYSYQLPTTANLLLQEIYRLRENQFGYGESFEIYRGSHLTMRASLNSTVAGTSQELLIKEVQGRVQGVFDFTANPRRQEKNDGEGWEVNFTYTVEYHKPVEYSMTYPLMVHQQVVDSKFLPLLPASPYEQEKRFSKSMNAFYYMEAGIQQQRLTQRTPIHYSPEQDAWEIGTTPQSTHPVASFMVSVEEDKPTQVLMNLKELGGYFVEPNILDWILKAESPYIHLPGMSPVQIAVYRNEVLASPRSIAVRPNGDVELRVPADGRKRYRVVLCVVDSLQGCHPLSLKRLANFPKAMCAVIQLTRTTTGQLNGLIPFFDMGKFYECATPGGMTREQGVMSLVSPFTVMRMGVEAWRYEELAAKVATTPAAPR